jgi:hypothetical protein
VIKSFFIYLEPLRGMKSTILALGPQKEKPTSIGDLLLPVMCYIPVKVKSLEIVIFLYG